jgi:hypothetical protein
MSSLCFCGPLAYSDNEYANNYCMILMIMYGV